jgi:hypothetical protein
MKKNNLNEEINRFKMIYNYNVAKTLNENNVLSEQIEDDLGTILRSEENAIKSALEDFPFSTKRVYTKNSNIPLKNADEAIQALKDGEIVMGEAGKIRKFLLNSNKISQNSKTALLDGIVNKAISKGGHSGMNLDELKDYYKNEGYGENADYLANNVFNKRSSGVGGQTSASTQGAGGTTQSSNIKINKKIDVNSIVDELKNDPNLEYVWRNRAGSQSRIKDFIRRNLSSATTVDEMITKLTPYIESLSQLPEERTILQKAKDYILGSSLKDNMKLYGAIGIAGSVAGVWTFKEFGSYTFCRLGINQIGGIKFNCDSSSSPGQQPSSVQPSSSGDKIKPANW